MKLNFSKRASLEMRVIFEPEKKGDLLAKEETKRTHRGEILKGRK